MDKEYIVTLHRKEDLEQFYNEMKLTNFPLVMKRPMSRNTHYMMTEEQAERLRQDPRVWGVEAVDSFHFEKQIVNYEPYTISGNFYKDHASVYATPAADLRQWGHLHCAGDQVQRRKNTWGDGTNPGVEVVTDTVEIFNNGKHVDVVIVDDPVSYDSEEWYSPTTGQTRFVQYQWFNELNSAVSSIDDDGWTQPTGTITYGDNASTPQYHGNHVCGTVAGQFYGWAREANIYNMAVTENWPSGQSIGSLLIFDYLRAFHRNKPINPDTGFRNPTITNHSYGGIRYMPYKGVDAGENPIYRLDFEDVNSVSYRGVTYNSSNPGPSGWTAAGLQIDFGVRLGRDTYPSWSSAVAADVQDAINDGVVIIGAAGNDNLKMSAVGDEDWDNVLDVSNGAFFYNRGAWPNSPDSGAINVGALMDYQFFVRSSYTQFGAGIDVFAPGDKILSAFGNTGYNDTKYTQGSANYYYPISGTSMASPQVAGIAACLATGKERFSNYDMLGYLNNHSIYGDMTFDVFGGNLDDETCRAGSPNKYLHLVNPRPVAGHLTETKGNRTTGVTYPRPSIYKGQPPKALPKTFPISVTNSGANHYVLNGDDRVTTHVDAFDPIVYVNSGDIIEFSLNVSGHPFLIKTAATTGTGDQLPSYLGSGSGVLGNGSVSGTVTLYTEGLGGTTLYYVCQFHSGMVGQISIA